MLFQQTSLKKRVFNATAWSLGGFALSFVIRLGSSLVMTRLLAPEMFGVVAIGQLIMVGLALFSDVGIRPSIIQSRRGSEPAFLNTAWTTQILRGLILWILALSVSLMIYVGVDHGFISKASTYGNPLVPAVIAAVSSASLIAGFDSTKAIEASRTLLLGKLTKLDLYSQIVGLLVTIGWALIDRSIWALVAGGLSSTLFRTLVSHLWLPGNSNRWQFEREAFAEIIRFGKWIFLSSILFFFASNGDRFILGGLVDAATLGTYVIAFTLLGSVDQILSKIIVDVSFPALSEVIRERPSTLTTAYYKFHAVVASSTYFCCGTLFVTGDAIVRFLYDSRYQEAGSILQVLALTLLPGPLRIATQAFLALRVERVYFVLHAIRLVALLCTVPLGFYIYGLPGAIWGIVFSYFANLPLIILHARRHGMFELNKELIALLAILPGLLIGELLKLTLHALKP